MSEPGTKAKGALLFVYTETPLHIGSGRGVGAIDLPIARERFSNLPFVPGSGLKGALREEWTERELDRSDELFGPDTNNASEYAGAISVVDARLLLLPVRSARGGWAWLTAPIALNRLRRDLELAGLAAPAWVALPAPAEGTALVAPGNALALEKKSEKGAAALVLEDDQMACREDPAVLKLAEWLGKALPQTAGYEPFRRRLPAQLAVVNDCDFTALAEQCTEVRTRVKLDRETRTVADGALFTEESLPPECLLWSLVLVSPSRKPEARGAPLFSELCQAFDPNDGISRMRLGGDQGIGQGLVGVALRAGEGR